VGIGPPLPLHAAMRLTRIAFHDAGGAPTFQSLRTRCPRDSRYRWL